MKVHSALMGVGGWYQYSAASWLADMRSKQVPTSTTSAKRLAALIRPSSAGGAESINGSELKSVSSEESENRSGSPLGPGGPFSCSQCRGAYPTREQLDKHEQLHAPNTQCCKICHKSFANVYRLQRHMISHDESALLRKFKCNDCDKAFKFKHHLKEHLRIHSGEKPFECANCGKKFSHSGSYSSHMTSKKCLVMNLKMGRIKPNNPALNPDRSPSRKRNSALIASQLNNNITQNGNSFIPILPKYNDAAAFFASMSTPENNYQTASLGPPSLHPFYMPPGIPMSAGNGIAPYSFSASLSQLFEQLASSQYSQRKIENESPKRFQTPSDHEEMIEEVAEDEDRRSECSTELVMDIDDDVNHEDKKPHDEIIRDSKIFDPSDGSASTNNNDPTVLANRDSYNSILGTVEASVAKHFLKENIIKSPNTDNVCPRIDSPTIGPIKMKEEPNPPFKCLRCNNFYYNENDLSEHEKLVCGNVFRKHEGLAAQMAETVVLNRIEAEMRASIQSGASGSEDEEAKDNKDQKNISFDDRKVRVRTAITEDQQSVLKEYYASNPRPNREEFKKISQQLRLDSRVVQVWFQNNRARMRKMNQNNSDQPLDLSTKKSSNSTTSSPPPSPPCSIAPSDNEEAVNLSHKSSRSPTPYQTSFASAYPHSNCSSSSFTDFRQSPSPGENNIHKRFYSQKLNPSVSMDKLLQYNDLMNARSPLLGAHLADLSRLSPSYDRTSWGEDSMVHSEYEDLPLKKGKLKSEFKTDAIEGQFVCDQCHKTFDKQSSLSRHIYEHSGQRPYKCVECPKAFKHKHHLTEHKRLHTGEKPFQCCKCLKKFSHSGSYSQHMNHRFAICKPYRD